MNNLSSLREYARFLLGTQDKNIKKQSKNAIANLINIARRDTLNSIITSLSTGNRLTIKGIRGRLKENRQFFETIENEKRINTILDFETVEYEIWVLKDKKKYKTIKDFEYPKDPANNDYTLVMRPFRLFKRKDIILVPTKEIENYNINTPYYLKPDFSQYPDRDGLNLINIFIEHDYTYTLAMITEIPSLTNILILTNKKKLGKLIILIIKNICYIIIEHQK